MQSNFRIGQIVFYQKNQLSNEFKFSQRAGRWTVFAVLSASRLFSSASPRGSRSLTPQSLPIPRETLTIPVGMDQKTDYAKDQEVKHRRRIVLPCVIPWEYGSNKYASQKGSGAFGTIRDAKLKVHSTKQLSESNDGVVPQITCPPLHQKRANQSGQSSFGNFREQVTKVTDKDGEEKVMISKIVDDKMTATILKKWDKPNKGANNSDIGRHRETISESHGGRRFTREETNQSRAAIPRFQDPRQTVAAQNQKNGEMRGKIQDEMDD